MPESSEVIAAGVSRACRPILLVGGLGLFVLAWGAGAGEADELERLVRATVTKACSVRSPERMDSLISRLVREGRVWPVRLAVNPGWQAPELRAAIAECAGRRPSAQAVKYGFVDAATLRAECAMVSGAL